MWNHDVMHNVKENNEQGHYSINDMEKLENGTIDTLRALFDDKTDYSLNWLFLSTSGVHGTYSTLDAIVARHPRAEHWRDRITVLVVCPRMCRMTYGTIWITDEDVPFLRKVVRKTLKGVRQSQGGNT